MRHNWERRDVADAYCSANGGAGHALGDEWRYWLANPVVWAVAEHLAANAKGRNNLELFNVVRVHQALAGPRIQGPDAWYADQVARRPLEGATVVDLGCGEGYLGRWLMNGGATYVGIDGSRAMLRQARKRFLEVKGTHHSLHQIDLDSETTLKKLGRHCKTNVPTLVTGIVVLDHLDQPQRLLKYLARQFAKDRAKTLFCFVVLNRDYFVPGSSRDLGSIKQEAKIASAQATVDVVLRSRRAWELMLREARLLSHSVVPLRFPLDRRPSLEDQSNCGLPAFHAIVCQPIGASVEAEGSVEAAFERIHSLGQGDDVAALSRFRDHLEVVSFEADESMLGQHNLGGDVYMMLEGAAELLIGGRKVQSFRPGDFFGEVETGCGVQSTYYTYPVRCAADGPARVLRIPEHVVSEMSRNHRNPGWRLFEQLRGRLATMVWRFNLRTRDVDSDGKWLKLSYASRVAREILASAEAIRQAIHTTHGDSNSAKVSVHPDSVRASHVVVSLDGLRETFQQQTNDRVNEALRAFVEMGVVDYFPGPSLTNQPAYKRALRERWVTVLGHSLELLNKERFDDDQRRRLLTLPLIENLSQFKVARELNDDKDLKHLPSNERAVDEFKRRVASLSESPNRFERWWIWATETNSYIHSGCRFAFVSVQDSDALRLIAVGEDEEVRQLVEATRSCNTLEVHKKHDRPTDLKHLGSKAGLGRVTSYLDAFFEQRLHDLRESLAQSYSSRLD